MNATISLNTEKWDSLINRLFGAMRDTKPFLKTAYATIGYKDILSHFSSESGPSGKWTPWSDNYRKHMIKIGKGGNKILQDNGTLRDEILPTGAKDNGVNSIVVFDNCPWSGYHDVGGPIIPQRSFMWLSDRATGNMAKMVADLIMGSL